MKLPGPFRLPVRVEVDPYGPAAGESNIFIVDATGVNLLIVAKHPVWDHMRLARRALAEAAAAAINREE